MSDLDIMNAAHNVAVAKLWQMLKRLHCCDCGFMPHFFGPPKILDWLCHYCRSSM